MLKRKFDINTMKFMSLFENLTRARVKDCFENNSVVIFIVEMGEIGKAIGKGGMNIRKIEGILKKKIKIVEYNDDLHEFVKNVVYPLRLADIEEQGNIVVLTAADSKTRGMLIGRGAVNLRGFEAVVKRYFEITELKVN